MDNNFIESMQFVLKWECGLNRDGSLKNGYINHPRDPGGETKYGISKRAHPELDIPNLSVEQALEIYYEDYWKKVGCQFLTMPLATVLFNTAVMSGPRRSLKILEDSDKSWSNYIFHFKNFLINLNRQDFIRGWLARVGDLSKFCTIYEQDHPKENKNA